MSAPTVGTRVRPLQPRSAPVPAQLGAVETALSLAAQTQPADDGRATWMLSLRHGDVLVADALESVRSAAPRLRLPACWVPVLSVPARVDHEQGRPLLRVLGTPVAQPAEHRGTRRLLRRRGLVGLLATAVLLTTGRANTAPFAGKAVVIVPVLEP